MGASFRSKEQVMELAGCDLLTVSPQLLEELSQSHVEVVRKLDATHSHNIQRLDITENSFRWLMNEVWIVVVS
jgi:transaldolase